MNFKRIVKKTTKNFPQLFPLAREKSFSDGVTSVDNGWLFDEILFEMVTDDELSRLAEQALLQEAKRGAVRAEISGPSGWLKKKLPSTNKKFLHNTLLGALAANRVKDRRERSQSEIGKRKRELEDKERNTYKRIYIQASTKSKGTASKKCSSGETDAPSKEDPKNLATWSESGLEFSNSSIVKKEKVKRGSELKTKSGSVLPRNIKFVSSKQNLTCDSHGNG